MLLKAYFNEYDYNLWRLGLPWWLSGNESCYQSRKHGFGLWSGRIPHGVEQLSPSVTATDSVLKSPVVIATDALMP